MSNFPIAEMRQEYHWVIYISRAHLSFSEEEGMENILCGWDVAFRIVKHDGNEKKWTWEMFSWCDLTLAVCS